MSYKLRAVYSAVEVLAMNQAIGYVFSEEPEGDPEEGVVTRFARLLSSLDRDVLPDGYYPWAHFADEPAYTLGRILESTFTSFAEFADTVMVESWLSEERYSEMHRAKYGAKG